MWFNINSQVVNNLGGKTTSSLTINSVDHLNTTQEGLTNFISCFNLMEILDHPF